MTARSRVSLAAVAAAACLVTVALAAPSDPFDLLIIHGRVVDGGGNPWFRADVGIRGGRIVEVGSLEAHAAHRTLDARDRIVAPGFIDVMGGSSLPLVTHPASAESKLRQGITTMMAGEGSSLAPQNDRTRSTRTDDGAPVGTAAFPLDWRTFAEYFTRIEKTGIALNIVHNVGAAQVRVAVLGDQDRRPNPAELGQMKALVDQAMRDGAMGLSSALIYPPGSYATTEELIELAKVVAPYGGVYLSHIRNESAGVLDAIREAIHIGEAANVPVHIYHIKAAGRDHWPLMTEALALIRSARERGREVTTNVGPYSRNGLPLDAFINPRHFAAGKSAFMARLADRELRHVLRQEIETTSDWENWYQHVGRDWDNVLVTDVGSAFDRGVVGRSVKDAARMRQADVWDTFFDLVLASARVAALSINEDQKREAMPEPFVSFHNDAAPVDPASARSGHPKAFGAFPKILAQFVRDEGVITLEDAIRKMTSLAANHLRVPDRGRIAPGLAADLVVFDPAQVQDRSTFLEPFLYAVGIDDVIVNGQFAIDEGRLTGVRAGQVLRHQPTEVRPARTTRPARPPVAPIPSSPTDPEVVTFPSGSLTLKGVLWKPAGKGPFPAVLFNHGSMQNPPDLRSIASLFTARGYILFQPVRRGQGRSADQGLFIGDVLDRARKEHGVEAWDAQMVELVETEQLADQLAGLAFLKRQPYVDTRRLAAAGVAFGGIQAVLAVEQNRGYRASIDFAGGARTWSEAPRLRERLTRAVRRAVAPIFFIQAENDFDLAPSRALSEEMARAGRSFRVKLYPPWGATREDGHGFGLRGASVWATDVFSFLDEHLK